MLKRFLPLLALMALAAWIPAPVVHAQQQVILCGAPNVPCSLMQPTYTGTGDPPWLVGGRANFNFGQLYGMFGPTSTLETMGHVVAADITNLFANCAGVDYLGADGACHNPSSGTGTVTSVGLTAPGGFGVTGSPITGAGTLGLTFTVSGLLDGTGSGIQGASFANVVALWSGTCNSTTYLRADGTCQPASGGAAGTVTSVALSAPAYLTVSGSPITSAGTLTLTGTSEPANEVLASPTGVAGALAPRALVSADIPVSLPQLTSAATLATIGTVTAGVWQGTAVGAAYGGTGTAGTLSGLVTANGASPFSDATYPAVTALWSGTCNSTTYLRGDGSCQAPSGTGTVTSVGLSAPSVFAVSGSPVTGSGTLAVTFAGGQTANEFLASPNGASGAVGLRAIVAADLPATITSNTSGNAGTATALAGTPTQCTSGQFATGIAASGNANCGSPPNTPPAGSQYQLQINGGSGSFGAISNLSGALLIGQPTGAPAFEVPSGDCTITSAGVVTCLKTNGVAFATTATNSSFSAITSGTNTATLTMGTGSVLTYSDTGIINANEITGTSLTGVTGSGPVVLGTSPSLITPNLGAATASALTLSALTGSTQCLHVNTSGVVSGTGSDCGAGGSGPTLQTNGTNNASQTALNIQNGPGIVCTNPSAGNVQCATTAPTRTVTTSPTVLSTDMGGVIYSNVSGGGTLTIPAIGSGVFGSGQTLFVVNYSASTLAVSTTPTVNAGGGCVTATGIPAGDAWQLSSNGTTLDCAQTVSSASGGTGSPVVSGGSGTSFTPVCSTGLPTTVNTYTATGNLIINLPTGCSDGQGVKLRIKFTASVTYTWNAGYHAGSTTGITALPTASSSTSGEDYLGFDDDTANSRFNYMAMASF